MPPQRWGRRAALACLLCVLPSIVWRVTMLAGVETGFADADWYRAEGARIAYVLGLDALQLAGALLCVGLVRPWSERVLAYVPLLMWPVLLTVALVGYWRRRSALRPAVE